MKELKYSPAYRVWLDDSCPIWNLEKKIMYIHIPKCAGKMVDKIFFDIESVPGSANHSSISARHHQMTTTWMKHLYMEHVDWNEWNVFTTIRNPFARVVSSWKYYNEFNPSISWEYYFDTEMWKFHLFRPMLSYIHHHDYVIPKERCFKIEDPDFESKLLTYGKSLGFDLPDTLPQINKAGKSMHYRDLFSTKQRKEVEHWYCNDFAYFGYTY